MPPPASKRCPVEASAIIRLRPQEEAAFAIEELHFHFPR